MNTEEALNILKQFLTLGAGMAVAFGLVNAQQATDLVGDVTVILPALIGAGSILWSAYAHWNMKKVPEASTALILPTGPAPVGTSVDLAPMTGLAKVVG